MIESNHAISCQRDAMRSLCGCRIIHSGQPPASQPRQTRAIDVPQDVGQNLRSGWRREFWVALKGDGVGFEGAVPRCTAIRASAAVGKTADAWAGHVALHAKLAAQFGSRVTMSLW